jgi:hypothetical protein
MSVTLYPLRYTQSSSIYRADKVAESSIDWGERTWHKNSWEFAQTNLLMAHHHFPLIGESLDDVGELPHSACRRVLPQLRVHA